jgi:hypothetical protein
MAGGVNPFGFSMGVLPAPRAPRQPKDLPTAPFGFAPPPSKWDQTKDILAPYVTGPMNAWESLRTTPLHILLGGGTQEQQEEVAGNSFNVAGNLAGASSVVPKPKNALNMGIRGFHGSPHDFPPVRLIEMPDGQRLYQNMNELADTPQGARIIQEFPLGRFDMSKIGTGEGAQAYGHGLYFAEAEDTARVYRDALKNKALIDPNADMLDPKRIAGELYDSWQGDIAGALDDAKLYDNSKAIIAELNKIKASPPAGRMYEVEINADPDAFLDWDKPLSEQPEAVRQALARLDPDMYSPDGSDYDPTELGQIAYQRMFHATRKKIGPNQGAKTYQAEISKTLNQAGIPGIKYLDAGSRGVGDGTRNYVVFDDKLISIVKKYGIAGASAMLGYNILDGMDPAQADELKRIEGNQ